MTDRAQTRHDRPVGYEIRCLVGGCGWERLTSGPWTTSEDDLVEHLTREHTPRVLASHLAAAWSVAAGGPGAVRSPTHAAVDRGDPRYVAEAPATRIAPRSTIALQPQPRRRPALPSAGTRQRELLDRLAGVDEAAFRDLAADPTLPSCSAMLARLKHDFLVTQARRGVWRLTAHARELLAAEGRTP